VVTIEKYQSKFTMFHSMFGKKDVTRDFMENGVWIGMFMSIEPKFGVDADFVGDIYLEKSAAFSYSDLKISGSRNDVR
jgi:hypothetical protein